MPLGGGGTDLPSYYTKYGGFFISAAIDKYMHIALNKRFEDGLRISYSTTEVVSSPDEVKHPIVREALKMACIKQGIEVVSIADAPASTGLGSSGSFTVGLLNALYAHKGISKTPQQLAEQACNIVMNKLKEPSGKQDEYAASFGGIRAYKVDRLGKVVSSKLAIGDEVLAELEHNILLFYTGIKRDSRIVLLEQKKKIEGNTSVSSKNDAIERMHTIKRIGLDSRRALESGDLQRFGELLDEHWNAKRGVTSGMSNDHIDRWYSLAKQSGALGGKIMGAGGGGFLVFYCENGKRDLRAALVREGLVEHRFRFDFTGSKIIYNL